MRIGEGHFLTCPIFSDNRSECNKINNSSILCKKALLKNEWFQISQHLIFWLNWNFIKNIFLWEILQRHFGTWTFSTIRSYAFRLDRSLATLACQESLTVRRYNRSPSLTICKNVPERSMNIFDRFRTFVTFLWTVRDFHVHVYAS